MTVMFSGGKMNNVWELVVMKCVKSEAVSQSGARWDNNTHATQMFVCFYEPVVENN